MEKVALCGCNLRGAVNTERVAISGIKLRKQNVFDDFIAAADWLDFKWLPSPKGWHSGRSKAAVLAHVSRNVGSLRRGCGVGVMDMLLSTSLPSVVMGSDYGSPDNREDFQAIYAIAVSQYYPETSIRPRVTNRRIHDDRGFRVTVTKFPRPPGRSGGRFPDSYPNLYPGGSRMGKLQQTD